MTPGAHFAIPDEAVALRDDASGQRIKSFGRFAVRLAKAGNGPGRCLRETGGSLSKIAGARGVSPKA